MIHQVMDLGSELVLWGSMAIIVVLVICAIRLQLIGGFRLR